MLADALSPLPVRRGGVAHLGTPERVWAVGPVYGRYGALCQLHEAMSKQIHPGDRVVYLGNYLGVTSQWSGEGKAVLAELMAFRNAIAPVPGLDVVFLRGRLEDLCRQLPRLPFQSNPKDWAQEALEKGVGAYLAAYDVNPQALADAANAGPFVANRFAYYWQRILSGAPAQEDFFAALADAAQSDSATPLAFIPEGLDPRLPLSNQREVLCWPPMDIGALSRYFNFARVVRGSGPSLHVNDDSFVLTLEGGNRLDGELHAICLNGQNRIIQSLTF